MNIKKYRWFNQYERKRLSDIVRNTPVIEPPDFTNISPITNKSGYRLNKQSVKTWIKL